MHDFQTTRWSLISQVRQDSDSGRVRTALGELCQRNWYPVYAFIRRRGIGVEDAQDLTQGFFQHLLTHDLISRAQREKGRFRSFLLGCLKHHLDNEWQKGTSKKRGGHLSPVHLDAMDAEERYRLESRSMAADDDTVFDQQWAQSILDQAVALLRTEQADRGRFELMLPALLGNEDRVALMEATGMNEGSLKVAIHRLRKRYRELLRQVVADTVETDAEVDEELAYLTACLRL